MHTYILYIYIYILDGWLNTQKDIDRHKYSEKKSIYKHTNMNYVSPQIQIYQKE